RPLGGSPGNDLEAGSGVQRLDEEGVPVDADPRMPRMQSLEAQIAFLRRSEGEGLGAGEVAPLDGRVRTAMRVPERLKRLAAFGEELIHIEAGGIFDRNGGGGQHDPDNRTPPRHAANPSGPG